MISCVAIAGYRSLRDVRLGLSRLNVVTGRNGSGKSSLYRALRLLADVSQGRIIPSPAVAIAVLGSAGSAVDRPRHSAHFHPMHQADELELAQLGRAVADSAIGPRKIDRIAVESRHDHMEEPAYYFAVELTPGNEQAFKAEDLVHLGLALTRELSLRGDETFPYIQVLTSEDWDRRYGA